MTTVERIPLPNILLKGEWHGSVYAICTDENIENHNLIVEQEVQKIKKEFDDKSHYTVSLREAKRELVFCDDRVNSYCSLIQFRIRDSY